MPKVRAVDEMNEAELRAELVSLLADGVIRYMQSNSSRSTTQIAISIPISRQLALRFLPNRCSM
jgi:hypothetical protein